MKNMDDINILKHNLLKKSCVISELEHEIRTKLRLKYDKEIKNLESICETYEQLFEEYEKQIKMLEYYLK
jgi:hypothetical protein